MATKFKYDRVDYRETVGYQEPSDSEMLESAKAFADKLRTRRTVREYSGRPIAKETLEQIVWAGASAPSGANQQPWHFAVVSDRAKLTEIRKRAEEEEREFYGGRAPESWRETLAPLETNEDKTFLDQSAALIVIFLERWGPGGKEEKRYYAKESVGIATGMLIAAAHMAGLCTLSYTPSPMKFLNSMLGRGDNEVPFLVLALGHPAQGVTIPDIKKKPLKELCSHF